MKLNLGCGNDVKAGFTNVDFRKLPGVDQVVDLSKFPWPWADGSVDEILMLDFLEHFPYRQTGTILDECWRVLEVGGKIAVQVPDVEHLGRVIAMERPFLCNKCGWEYPVADYRADFFICKECRQGWYECAEAAVARLYGGQDYEGNWHQTAFSELFLDRTLLIHGFDNVESIKKNQNGETYHQNWNIRLEARKCKDLWGYQR